MGFQPMFSDYTGWKPVPRPDPPEPVNRRLLNLLMESMAAEEGIVLLLLDALRDGLLIARREVAGRGLALFAGFGAFESDDFLHGWERVKGSANRKKQRKQPEF